MELRHHLLHLPARHRKGLQGDAKSADIPAEHLAIVMTGYPLFLSDCADIYFRWNGFVFAYLILTYKVYEPVSSICRLTPLEKYHWYYY